MLSERDLLRRVDGLTVDEVRLSVRRGWVRPSATDRGEAYLEVDVARLRLIRELRHDLELDEEAIPLVLSLLDRVHTLRTELRLLARALADQPDDVQRRVADTVRRLRDGGEG